MKNLTITKTIAIEASRDKVWRVFTDPGLSRQLGGEYVSEWTPGSAFGWKGIDGLMYTRGTILDIRPASLLKHDLHDLADPGRQLSVITYELTDTEGGALLAATEEIAYEMTDQQFTDAGEGWELALQSLKELAENIR